MAWREPANIPPVIVAVSADRVRWRLVRRRGGARKAVIDFVDNGLVADNTAADLMVGMDSMLSVVE